MNKQIISKKHILKEYNHPIFKITVEELSGFKFIATDWRKEYCNEYDRTVYAFETASGAYAKAFELMCEWMTAIKQVSEDL